MAETSKTLFDWKSLITPAVSLGFKALGDKVAPGADLQSVQNTNQNNQANLAEQQRQFNIQTQLAQQKSAQSNQIRQTMMPGMYTNLGFSPEQGQKMAADYATKSAPQNLPTLGAPAGGGSYGYTPGGTRNPSVGGAPSGQPGLGSTLAKTGLSLGTSMLPGILGKVLGGAGAAAGAAGAAGAGGAAAGAGGAGAAGGLGVLGATGIGAAIAAPIIAGILWKKSQTHPVADKWVQGEQNPFDQSMARIDQAGLPPDQAKQAKTQNAQNYLRELAQFAQGGNKNMTVARQAADTFRQWYGDPMQYGIQLPF